MMNRLADWCVAVLLFLPQPTAGAATRKNPPNATPGGQMDYGPFLCSSVLRAEPPKGARLGTEPVLAAKGITIDVGHNSAVCFDTDTVRLAAGWTGGFLDLSRTNLAELKGDLAPRPAGQIQFGTRIGPGWAKSGSFADPRPGACGPLPAGWAHYKGLYRHGRQIVLSYSVGATDVLELPGSFASQDDVAFTRSFHIGKSATPLEVLVYDGAGTGSIISLGSMPGGGTTAPAEGSAAIVADADHSTAVAVVGAPRDAELKVLEKSRIVLRLPSIDSAAAFKVVIAPLSKSAVGRFPDFLRAAGPVEDLPSLCHGGPALWKEPITTHGRRSTENAAYVVDTIGIPDDNPWHSWMRPGGFDFFSDGRCAVCTMNGDVWIVSGIDADLQHITWKRFAAGLYEPLGLKIVNDRLYVLGRDQITILHDLDDDGEADFYENFFNGGVTSPIYHAFTFDLQADSHGDFWYVVDGNAVPLNVPMHGCVMKVLKDGSRGEVIATGLRAANGTAIGPHDEFVCADNQGNWTPVCRINLVKRGGSYGFNGDPRVTTSADIAHERKTYDPPLCWIPYEKDNCTGGQVFATDPRWGPLSGHMLSTSYGKCRLFLVSWEEIDGLPQGGTIELPLQFTSGIMRARVNPADGQVYVCGLKGWQTSANRDGCLQRVRYTGKPVHSPEDVHVKHDGIEIHFTCPLDPTTAADEQSYAVEQWNYRWSAKYGSSKYKISQPTQVGTDEVQIKSVRLLPDHQTVFLEIPSLRPVMQMGIQMHVIAADSAPIESEADLTINRVPGLNDPPVLSAP